MLLSSGRNQCPALKNHHSHRCIHSLIHTILILETNPVFSWLTSPKFYQKQNYRFLFSLSQQFESELTFTKSLDSAVSACHRSLQMIIAQSPSKDFKRSCTFWVAPRSFGREQPVVLPGEAWYVNLTYGFKFVMEKMEYNLHQIRTEAIGESTEQQTNSLCWCELYVKWIQAFIHFKMLCQRQIT